LELVPHQVQESLDLFALIFAVHLTEHPRLGHALHDVDIHEKAAAERDSFPQLFFAVLLLGASIFSQGDSATFFNGIQTAQQSKFKNCAVESWTSAAA